MNGSKRTVLAARRADYLSACNLVASSVKRTAHFDPDREYTPDEREPFDALCDRFVRAVETAIGLFRAYERFAQGISSPTLRDMLHVMEKTALVTDAERWLDMREVRNRIVHDYTPAQIERLYADIRGPFFAELTGLAERVKDLSFEA